MGRPLWFVAGAGVGVYAAARARRAAESLTADGLRDRLRGGQVGAPRFAEEVPVAVRSSATAEGEQLGLRPTSHEPGPPELTASTTQENEN